MGGDCTSSHRGRSRGPSPSGFSRRGAPEERPAVRPPGAGATAPILAGVRVPLPSRDPRASWGAHQARERGRCSPKRQPPSARRPLLSPRGPCQGSFRAPRPPGWTQLVGGCSSPHLYAAPIMLQGRPPPPSGRSLASVCPIDGPARPETGADLLTQAAGLPHPVRASSIADHPACCPQPPGSRGRTTAGL